MTLPLPNLDDRRWIDLVEEGRSLIPLYAPEWTDHNIHDPGIMLMELLAWIAEMDMYWLNRIPDHHRRKFLALAGIRPRPPQAARAVLQVHLGPMAPNIPLPAGVIFEGQGPDGQPVPFRALHPVTLAPGRLAAIQYAHEGQFVDLTARWNRGEVLLPLGEDPRPGTTLYLGFDRGLPTDVEASLWFTWASPRTDTAERERIVGEQVRRREDCGPLETLLACDAEPESTSGTGVPSPPLAHHSVRTEWEYLDAWGRWRRLDPAAGQVVDDTRAFTLDGQVRLTIPMEMGKRRVGRAEGAWYYVRCRVVTGAYDAPPRLQSVAFNGIAVEQSAPIEAATWPIHPTATLSGPAPTAGVLTGVRFRLNDDGEIVELDFADEEPRFRVLSYTPPGAQFGRLRLEAAWLGTGDGRPHQVFDLPEAPVQASSLRLYTLEADGWHTWEMHDDFDASGRADAHFVLAATEGVITCGDGERGRVVPAGAQIMATYRSTQAEAGNLKAGSVTRLADTAPNRARLLNLEAIQPWLAGITNLLPASGGTAAETVDQATGRALTRLAQSRRAVTLADYEALALETPGVRSARVAARANLHPGFPCYTAPGVITVIVLPTLPAGRPAPSSGLRQAVAAYLNRRRVLGTRVEVVGPIYREVGVRATVRARAGVNLADLQQRIVTNLNLFFDPLTGGPEGDGWPFGRDVYRSEVLQVVDETPGVDHVLSLDLLAEGCDPQCGNVCLGPLGLVAAGKHEIEVVAP